MPKKGDCKPIVERIQLRLRLASNGCLEYTGALVDGYGYISSDIPGGSPKRVHVVMWVYHRGPIPVKSPKLCVLHKCDNRRCCNVSHLFLGTRKNNNDDMRLKGRAKLSHEGTTNAAAKLTDKQVLEIRSSKLAYRTLAKMYHVSFVMIGKIKREENWKHLLLNRKLTYAKTR